MNASYLQDLVPEGGWLDVGSARLTPLTDHQLTVRQKLVLSAMLKVGTARCPNLFRTMFRNLRVYLPFAKFNAIVMPKGRLQRRHTELAILRIGWKNRSLYEWGQHVDIGLRIGLTPMDIYHVTLGPRVSHWEHCEAMILQAVDEMIDDKTLSAATWEGLSQHFSQKLMIELMFLISAYSGLACVLNSAGVQLEPDMQQRLAQTPIA